MIDPMRGLLMSRDRKERDKLKCETGTKAMQKRVLRAAKKYFGKTVPHYKRRPTWAADFEHGQWWLTNLASGACYSVVDAEGGSAVDGFDFEQVSEGDEGVCS
jgi:hypothetical protein